MVVHTVMTAPITRMLRILRRYTTEAQTGELNHFFGLKGVAEKFQLINTDSNRDGSFKLPFFGCRKERGRDTILRGEWVNLRLGVLPPHLK